MMKKLLILFGGVVVGLVMLAYFLLQPKTAEPAPQQTLVQETAQPTPTAATIPAGWKTFTSEELGFSFSYPASAEIKYDSTDPLIVVVFERGANQKGQTELYDGLSVTFQVLPITGDKSFKQQLDAYILDQTSNGIDLVEPVTQTQVNGYAGYQYTLRGLGEYSSVAVELPNQTDYVAVTNTSADYQGTFYQEQGQQLLSTLRLIER